MTTIIILVCSLLITMSNTFAITPPHEKDVLMLLGFSCMFETNGDVFNVAFFVLDIFVALLSR